MAVKGVFASDQNIAGSRKGDFASSLLQVMPTGSAPLLALTSGMPSADAVDTVITWFEENHLTGRVNIIDNILQTTDGIIDDISTVIAGQIYIVEATGEYLYIDSVSGSVVTVTRGFAGTTNTSVDGSSTPVPIQLIGNAYEEGSAKPTSVANLGFPRFNYQQIFRNPWDVTGTARAVQYYTGDIVAKNKADAGILHAEAIERSLLWGKLAIGSISGSPFRTMDGIVSQISKHMPSGLGNITTQDSNTTWDDIDVWLQAVFARNIKGKPNERIFFADNTVIGVLNSIAKIEGTHNLVPSATTFGMKINTWNTPYGDAVILTHPLMNESIVWRGDLYAFHPGAIRTRYLRRTMEDNNDVNGSRAGVDADFGTLTTEMSCEYRAVTTGGIYTGISVAAAI